MKSDKVITRLIGEGQKIIIPKEVVDKYRLGIGDYVEWHIGDELILTFGEMIKKEKGKENEIR